MTENKTKPLPCPLELTLDRLRDHKAKCQNSIDEHDFVKTPQHLLDEYHETQKDIDAVKRVRDMGYFREWDTRATVTPSDKAAALDWFEKATLDYRAKEKVQSHLAGYSYHPSDEEKTIRAALQQPDKNIGCESCDFTGRIEVEPDSEFSHPCDTCQPELNKEFQAGYNSAQQPDDCKTCNTYAAQGLKMMRRLEENKSATRALVKSAEALIERWDSPKWKYLPATAKFVNRLRNQVAKHKAKVQG